MVGAVGVTDWDDLADALAARGHPRGDVYHLPELDGEGGARPPTTSMGSRANRSTYEDGTARI